MKTIVTTTISGLTEATIKFSEMKDWKFIVVGDKKTPHDEYKDIDCHYMSPEEQADKYPSLSDAIGWNSIQRRNIGFVEAYNSGASVVATVDDDNIPYDGWGTNLLVDKTIDANCWESKNGVFDPLSVTQHNSLWHRGYPLSLVDTKNDINCIGVRSRRVLVQADLWDGDPDVDAIARILYSPEVKFDSSIEPYFSNNISPFNSQNTFLSREVIPYYMVLPHCGRMDDIWGSYILQNRFPDSVVYSKASVYQKRNPHDLVLDMEKEIIGYRNTLDLIRGTYQLPNNISHAYELYQNSFF